MKPSIFCLHKSYRRLVTMLLAIILILPVLLAGIQAYISNESESQFWSFGYKFKEHKYRMAVTFIGDYMHYTVFYEFNLTTALSCCLLIKHCSASLLQFHSRLKRMDFDALIQNGFKILNDYKMLEENVRLLKKALSMPLCFIILSCILNLYSVLSYFLSDRNLVFLTVEYIMHSSMGIVVISSIIICSSDIPESIQNIKETAGTLIEKHQLCTSRRKQDISFLNRLEKKKIIFLSAGGVIDLKKDLLLSIAGNLFTYGLLFINLGKH
ncbi:hypothetical protein HNY73_020230 [Argiope bruennichi]|uniref:Gustatory receptor n=1 Tax=Argiope bruennichi TaxID=94029 RepID=A0A8T0E7H6_ARGBR|nr:hypothetical protein HNY73_020230 [Argiope bruennichi]